MKNIDLSNLPKELLDQLKLKDNSLDFKIIEALNALGGTANIDEILVAYYRQTKKVLKRSFLANKLYRMTKANVIIAIPHCRGVYKVNQEEV